MGELRWTSPEDPDNDSYPDVFNCGKEACSTRKTKTLGRNIYLGNKVSLFVGDRQFMFR